MRIHSQEEIDWLFREMGLATESDRRRFQFESPTSAAPREEDVQIFIRTQSTTAAEGGDRNAKLA